MTVLAQARLQARRILEVRVCPWPLTPSGIDLPLLFATLVLLGFGLLMVYSSSYIYAAERTGDGFAFIIKQGVFASLGLAALIAVSRVDYRFWQRHALWCLLFATALLALVWVPGVGLRSGGAQRWLSLGPAAFQPAEFARFAIVVFAVRQLVQKQQRLGHFLAGVVAPVLFTLPALALLLLQPDFGSTVLCAAVVFALMFVAGVPMRSLAVVAGTLVLAATALITTSEYRRSRVLGFLDPWADPGGRGFQILQSLVGFHEGGVAGVGLGNGKEKLFYLPEAHNDFIFAVIGEELGFLGVVAVIALYLFVLWRGLRIASQHQRKTSDEFGAWLAVGLTLALVLRGFINLAVVLGLVPTKGITLPLISYGGSALVMDLITIGVLLSISRGPQSAAHART